MSYFQNTTPSIEGNKMLRKPQIEAYLKIKNYFEKKPYGEALVVLPTGTGKSGLISIAPFGVANKRVLVITPGIVTKDSVVKELHPLEENFWLKYDVLFDPEDAPVVIEYSPSVLDESLINANFVITNVHKLQEGRTRSLLRRVPRDFFDMIIVDEAHHSVAHTWQNALKHFNKAKILHVTGTPYRGDNIPIPGDLIHNTRLSEAMAMRLIKGLRKTTVNNENLTFTIPDDPHHYTIEEVLKFKDKEWVQRSVALSKKCSFSVIDESIKHYVELTKLSPSVPHKILAIACSIKHAEDLRKWYLQKGMRPVIVHSDMDNKALEKEFIKIENHACNVVISVNMLMEGYDHKYLTILALFRPYRSLNAFAQVVGRVLRSIPEKEVNNDDIDNNAIVIYHEETGLDDMWEYFRLEVELSKKIRKTIEHTISDKEYESRESIYAIINAGDTYQGDTESYLEEIDFNELFENARLEIEKKLDDYVARLKKEGFSPEEIEVMKKALGKKETSVKKDSIDRILIEKRPEAARQMLRKQLESKAQLAASNILEEKGIDPKSCSLYPKFRKLMPYLKDPIPNDGILVRYLYNRIMRKFGPIQNRSIAELQYSLEYLDKLIEEVRSMIL